MKRSTNISACFLILGLVSTALAQDRSARSDKSPGLSFNAVSSSPVAGYNQMTLDGQTYYVAPKPSIPLNQVANVRADQASLFLSGAFADTPKSDKVGVLIDGKLVGVGSVSVNNGVATITGLSETQSQRVVHMLSRVSASPNGAAFTITPAGQVNGEYVFDVFLKSVPELRTYQVKLEVTGGTAGTLTMTDVRIDKRRADFVFAGNEAIAESDPNGSRLGGTLLTSSPVVVDAPKYLGTWKFRPTADAAGTFDINVVTGSESFISNMQNQMLPVGAVGATVQVGSKGRLSD